MSLLNRCENDHNIDRGLWGSIKT